MTKRKPTDLFVNWLLAAFGVIVVTMAVIFVLNGAYESDQSYTWKKVVVYNVDHDRVISTVEGQCILLPGPDIGRKRYLDLECLKDESGQFKVQDRIWFQDGIAVFTHELPYPKRVDGQELRKTVAYPD